MTCITAKEQSDLLLTWSVPEDPYYGSSAPLHYAQFYPPKDFRSLQYFTAAYLEAFASDTASLIVFTDWALYAPHEMELIAAARLGAEETRPLIEASGQLFTSKERNLAAAYFSLAVAYGWSSYLYLPSHKTTLFNWEGDIIDFWSDSEKDFIEMRNLISTYNLLYTDKTEQGA